MTSALPPDAFPALKYWCCDRLEGRLAVDDAMASCITPHDRLLWWMSEKGTGTWSEFTLAQAWVDRAVFRPEKPTTVARALRDLGHAEFSWSARTWSIAPTVLTMLPNSGGLGYLTGARTSAVLRAIAESGLDFYPTAAANEGGPHAIFLLFDSPDVTSDLADEIGVRYTFGVAGVLGGMLPDLAEMMSMAAPATFPINFPYKQFDPLALKWIPRGRTDAPEAPGVYRIEHHHPIFRYVTEHHEILACEPEVGRYEALRTSRRIVIAYEQAARCLRVPAAAPLPPLHARAAVLSSGLLPRVRRYGDVRMLLYDNVDGAVADNIMRSLSQAG